MAEHTRLQITVADSHGTARTKKYIVENPAVFPECDLGFCAAIQIVEYRLGQPALRQSAQILDIDDS